MGLLPVCIILFIFLHSLFNCKSTIVLKILIKMYKYGSEKAKF